MTPTASKSGESRKKWLSWSPGFALQFAYSKFNAFTVAGAAQESHLLPIFDLILPQIT